MAAEGEGEANRRVETATDGLAREKRRMPSQATANRSKTHRDMATDLLRVDSIGKAETR
jgi:hypothetical protein